MKSQIKLLANTTWHSVILEFLLKDKYMKEVISEMAIIMTSPTQEILRQNHWQIMFLENLALKQNFDKTSMINKIMVQCWSLHSLLITKRCKMLFLNQQY